MKDSIEIKLNKKSIEELRRIYDDASELYKQIRLRVLTFLGADFALFSYLYINNSNLDLDIRTKLFFPEEPSLIIIYIFAFASCLIAFVLLILAMQTVVWRYPTEIDDHEKLEFNSELKFLEYIRKEYIEAIRIDISHCEKKQKITTAASYLLMFGGIVLVIIKNF